MGTVTIAAIDMRFEPARVAVYPGQQVTVRNDGVLWHGMVVEAWGIDTGELDPGELAAFTVPETAPIGSSVTFFCPVPDTGSPGWSAPSW